MSIKDKAVEKIAAQLIALVGEENFIIVTPTFAIGKYTTAVAKKTTRKNVYNFKNTGLREKVQALKPGESTLITLPNIPVDRIQSACASAGLAVFGLGNTMTSRRADGSVEVLRLS